ncbi:hypothetical protein HOG21_01355 [bacterium]|nr:hypothetical protein [bacterium]
MSFNFSFLILSFLSIILIVADMSFISILLKNQVKNFLLFIFITNSQKSNSLNELYIVLIISTSAKSANLLFQIISTSA